MFRLRKLADASDQDAKHLVYSGLQSRLNHQSHPADCRNPMNWLSQKIAFIGTGQMATALAAGFVRELILPEQISGYDPIESSRVAFASRAGDGVRLFDSASEAIKGASVVILAVKPQEIGRAHV